MNFHQSILFVLIFTFYPTIAMSQQLPAFLSSHFSTAGECTLCHSSLQDQAGNDVSIDSHWRSAMMANSAKDPYFLAKVSSEIQSHPELQAVLEDTCSKCHMPMARTQNAFDQAETKMFGDGLLNPENELHTLAQDGVSCTLCHQIQDTGFGEKSSFSGEYLIDPQTERPDRIIYSPFENPAVTSMQILSKFTPQYGEHIKRSELCATCHTLYTPYLDENGNIAGEFPEQAVYLEWLNSSFSSSEPKACQDCHMPVAEGAVVTSTIPQGLTAKEPFLQHHFVGGNAFMIQLHTQNRDELNINAGENHLSDTLARTTQQLQTNTATLSMPEASVSASQLQLSVQIGVLTGHKYPAAFPSRRAWLHVTVFDSNDSVLFESGQPLEDGRIQGNDADSDAALYEPHYDRITQADQVQIYEAVMGNTQNNVTYGLLTAAQYLKDNRLLPKGFDRNQAVADIRSRGQVETDENFAGGIDRVEYWIDTTGSTGPYRVRVELLHQSVSYPFVRDLMSKDTPEINRFVSMYSQADQTPVIIDSLEITGLQENTGINEWRTF